MSTPGRSGGRYSGRDDHVEGSEASSPSARAKHARRGIGRTEALEDEAFGTPRASRGVLASFSTACFPDLCGSSPPSSREEERKERAVASRSADGGGAPRPASRPSPSFGDEGEREKDPRPRKEDVEDELVDWWMTRRKRDPRRARSHAKTWLDREKGRRTSAPVTDDDDPHSSTISGKGGARESALCS